ncbi:4216_t:CDS:2 [Acaulospora morrowiae]|uniref:4216_t:CDS:1 n=1 Tax=Acaulospora morrowiae TaxID=94023 RepID=A0A9N9B8K7_9GLOM|nr:4216_t:CDS:2 [Acaulospora morrowiae]
MALKMSENLTMTETDNFSLLYQNFENQFMELLRMNPFTLFLQKQAMEIDRLNKQLRDMEFKFESCINYTDLEQLKSKIGEIEIDFQRKQKESESLKSEVRYLKQENKDLKNQISRMTKDLNHLQTSAKEFDEVKERVVEIETQVQQNVEDNIAIEIRVNKLERAQLIRDVASAKNEKIKLRQYSGDSKFKKISQIHEKYKSPLTSELRERILKSIDLDPSYTQKNLLPAYNFFHALKQFSDRFLQGEDLNESSSLATYLCDPTLNFWPEIVSEKLVKNLFPDSLMVKHTFAAYDFIIEQASKYHEFAENNKKILES